MPLQLSADVPDGACQTCHPQPTAGRGQPSAFEHHPAHDSARCISCHAGVVHGRDPDRPPLGSMAFCQECHNSAKRDGAKRDGTTASAACGTCHEPPHADTGECAACHQLTDWKQPVPLSASIPAASCRECHARPRDVVGATSVFTHGRHGTVDCASCHVGILHPSAKPSSPLTMDERLECHDGVTREGVTASADCETCHKPPHAAVGGAPSATQPPAGRRRCRSRIRWPLGPASSATSCPPRSPTAARGSRTEPIAPRPARPVTRVRCTRFPGPPAGCP